MLLVDKVCYDASHHGLRIGLPISAFLNEEGEQVGELRVEFDFDPRTGKWSFGHTLYGQVTDKEEKI